MSVKTKGINAERDLIHKFWSKNIPALRVAGSGSSKYPSPDIIVGNNQKKIAIEVKITKDVKKYFTTEEINNLKYFSTKFGADPWIAIKFKKTDWLFLPINNIQKTERSYLIEINTAKKRGILFEEFERNFE